MKTLRGACDFLMHGFLRLSQVIRYGHDRHLGYGKVNRARTATDEASNQLRLHGLSIHPCTATGIASGDRWCGEVVLALGQNVSPEA